MSEEVQSALDFITKCNELVPEGKEKEFETAHNRYERIDISRDQVDSVAGWLKTRWKDWFQGKQGSKKSHAQTLSSQIGFVDEGENLKRVFEIALTPLKDQDTEECNHFYETVVMHAYLATLADTHVANETFYSCEYGMPGGRRWLCGFVKSRKIVSEDGKTGYALGVHLFSDIVKLTEDNKFKEGHMMGVNKQMIEQWMKWKLFQAMKNKAGAWDDIINGKIVRGGHWALSPVHTDETFVDIPL
jgi:hypothetical protein